MKNFLINFTSSLFTFLTRTFITSIMTYVLWSMIITQLPLIAISFPLMWLIIMLIDILHNHQYLIIDTMSVAQEQQHIANLQLNNIALLLVELIKYKIEPNTPPQTNDPIDNSDE